jgi:hypothetical protein
MDSETALNSEFENAKYSADLLNFELTAGSSKADFDTIVIENL